MGYNKINKLLKRKGVILDIKNILPNKKYFKNLMIYFSVILTFILFTLVLNYIAPNLKLIDIPNQENS